MMQSGAWKALTVVVGFLLVGGCATIESYETLEQPTGSTLKTHINGKIFKVKRTSDLPNAFGKADLWGGEVNRGYMELRYLGLTDDGRLILRLTDVETESTETSMSRYGVGRSIVTSQTTGSSTYTGTYNPTGTGYSGTIIGSGTSTTTGSGIYIPPREGKTEMLPPNTTEFLFDTQANPLVIGNIQITFLDASQYDVKYQLRKREEKDTN